MKDLKFLLNTVSLLRVIGSVVYVNHGNQPCMQASFLFNYSESLG